MGKKFYDYTCAECGARTRSLTKPMDPVRCPACGSTEPKEMIETDREETTGKVRGV